MKTTVFIKVNVNVDLAACLRVLVVLVGLFM